jgi:hypothetical protein
MRYFIFSLALLFSGYAFALPGIHEALKNPSAVSSLKLSGEKDEAALLVKNHAAFTALKTITISGISDSVTAEQDIAAVAACEKVTKLKFENCGFTYLSGAVKMLISVHDVEISGCKKLNAENTFSTLAEMPSLKAVSYSTDKLDRLPSSFVRLRGLEKISFHNEDLSLADGYALNTAGRASLLADETLQLGFGNASLVLEYSCYDKASAKEHIGIMRDMLQGVAGMSNGMTFPRRNIAFTRENPLVKPPIAGLDVWKNVYSTNAETGGLVEYSSGTKIIIPSHAFVDANGNEVKGDVTIDYREFRDPVDILVSGIPMVYDSAGQKGNFESAGMFELNASVNGQEVFLAPGKKVDMEFAVVDTASSFNFYKLDPAAGWVYQSTPGTVEQKQQVITKIPFALSQAVSKFKALTYDKLKKKPALGDTLSFEHRYADTNYIYMTKDMRVYGNARLEKRWYRNATRWRGRKVAAGKGNTCFMLYRAPGDYDNNPEMQAFSGVLWQITEPVSRQDFRKYFGRGSGINDIRISYNGGASFTMELKYPWGYKQVDVMPVKVSDKKPVAYPDRICSGMYKNYSRSLKRRKIHLDRSINVRFRKLQAWKRAASRDSVAYWQHLNHIMNPDEKPMDYNTWVNYIKAETAKLDSINGTQGFVQGDAVYQALSLDGFGVYNCDQIRRIQNPVEVYAVALAEDGKIMTSSRMYIVQKRKNMAFCYTNMNGSTKIAYGADDENKMLAVSPDGSLAYANETDFTRRQKISSGTYAFPTKQIATKPVSPEELRNILFPAE